MSAGRRAVTEGHAAPFGEPTALHAALGDENVVFLGNACREADELLEEKGLGGEATRTTEETLF